jgi:hypothetical protein
VTVFLSSSQAAQLQRIARRYKKRVKLGKPWNEWTDDELWRQVLGQIVAIGRAEPGERLQHDPKIGRKVSIKKLKSFHSDTLRQKYVHKLFAKLEVRFSLGSNWEKDWKAEASVRNFKVLREAGGPRNFFRTIASCKTEEARIQALQKALKRYGNKGARDTLIALRLAENCMALDARIFGVLRKVGVKLSPTDIYKQLERELIEKVATPLRISGARLDRLLFQNYDRISEHT